MMHQRILKIGMFCALLLLGTLPVQANAVTDAAAAASAVEPETQAANVTDWLTARRWSPYVVGLGIGILAWLSFLLSDKAIGVSTAYVRTCGMLESAVKGRHPPKKTYYHKFVPKIDWEWMLVSGLFVGAFVSAITSGDFAWVMIPSKWAAAVGHNDWLRWMVAFIGGIIMSVGARWAGGCTSGHGISGTLQLVVSSWLAVICFFISGILTALLIYKVLL